MCFKVDTGASVTAIPETEYTQEKYGSYTVTRRPLLGPASQPLDVKGQTQLISLAGQGHQHHGGLLSARHHVAVLRDHQPVSAIKTNRAVDFPLNCTIWHPRIKSSLQALTESKLQKGGRHLKHVDVVRTAEYPSSPLQHRHASLY
ncbi:hypothetical protein EYF80_038722 [Liparis tanakae]|uniref:Peptidase A2 domain-containing protein n=1 Tax=Liparis tanakae TaxID=230148 RepID=A0A4Z2GBY1_9TELE|nr:hypothetical protein EYF80_038722 [Liparis tanakae]